MSLRRKVSRVCWTGRRVAKLLSVTGATPYGLGRNLVRPNKPNDKTLDETAAVLKEHFEAIPLLVAKWVSLNRRNQKANQPVAQYLAEFQTVCCQLWVRRKPGRVITRSIRQWDTKRSSLDETTQWSQFCQGVSDRAQLGDGRQRCTSLGGTESETAAAVCVHRVKLQAARNCHRCKESQFKWMSF